MTYLKDLSNKVTNSTIITIVLLIFYAIGTIGIILNPLNFARLTPLNLLLTMVAVMWMHPVKNIFFFVQLLFLFFASYSLEYVGVNTGLIFGKYTYGESLGIKIGNTPLLIGINWIIVIYSSLHLVQTASKKLNIKVNALTAAAIGGLLMVILDLLIEQVAPKLDFWAFETLEVPLQNYTAWFFFGFTFCFWLIKSGLISDNPIGWRVYIIQMVFFAILNCTYYY
jgi:putative membrane protein